MRKIAVIGLGHVGLPVALAFARRFAGTVGFDRDRRRVARVADAAEAAGGALRPTADPDELAGSDFYVICVPTPIDEQRRPDLSALVAAGRTVGRHLRRGDVVVLESTVFPGATEGILGAALEESSGLRSGVDFKLGYSPERINPGDPAHGFESITKVIAAQDAETLDVLEACYGAVVEAGLHRARTIEVAEAAKVIENVQRDLNIALVNELAMLFDRLGLDTREVLEAAATKWNFHPYRPGLVGGHCIGVDPYYLTSKAESIGFHPQVILAGRRINDGMGAFVARRTVELLAEAGRAVAGARVACLGLAFKPDVPDLRNSRVPDVVRALADRGAEVLVHDPLVEPSEALEQHGIELVSRSDLDGPDGPDGPGGLDAVVLAVAHRELVPLALDLLRGPARLLVDVMWAIDPADVPAGKRYWRL